jgi:transcriptional regulator with XRE-family HTH domain
MDVRSRVGANVKRLREAKGLSQEELAFDAEMHRTYVSGIERGKRNPTVTVVERLADALGAKASDLLS